MKIIARVLYYLISLALIGYLGWSYYTGIANYAYTRDLDWIFTLVTALLVLGLLVYSITSTYSHKKRIMIVGSIVVLMLGQTWFLDTATYFGSDLVKIYAVITIFKALFGAFNTKKEVVKGEYSKKTQIIEI